jgi:hypothetical protein
VCNYEALASVAVTFWYAWLFNHASGSSLLALIARGLSGRHRLERASPVGPTALALANRQRYPLLREPPDYVVPSVMALLVHLITRRPSAFLVPLVDSVKRNIEQRRNLIRRKGTFRLSAGRFA